MSLSKPCLYLLTLALTSVSPPLAALPSDREQPIHISSDEAERNERLGTTVYTGDVQMDQGTLRILADRVVIHTVDNEISKVVATGKPAHYQQQPSADKGLVVAKGNTIDYRVAEEKLYLKDNASLRQDDGTTLTGERIDYDIRAEVVKADSRGEDSRPERIHMVIPPKNERGTTAN